MTINLSETDLRRIFPHANEAVISSVGAEWSDTLYQRPSNLTDVRPIAHPDGGDRFGQGDELSPSLACRVDDGVDVFEDAVGEPIGAQVLPGVFDGVQFGRARRQEDRGDVFGHVELGGGVPSGAVEQQHSVRALGDVARDFVEVELHRFGVGIGQRERRADAARRADGAEQIGVVVALIGGLARPRSPLSPLPNLAVLLADARFVLKPDFDRSRRRHVIEMRLQRAWEVFL